MSIDLSKMTPEEITQVLADLAAGGLVAFGQPQLAALVPVVSALAVAVEKAVQAPSPSSVLTAEVDAIDAAADAAEAAKYSKP